MARGERHARAVPRLQGGSVSQSRAQSMIESAVNVVIGYMVALGSQLVVFPMFGVHLPLQDNLLIGLWFTAISLVRSYLVRRWFNRMFKA